MYIGIDLGGTNIAAGVVDEVGKIIYKSSVPTGVRNFFCKLSFCGKIIFFRAGHSSCPIYNIS